MRPNWENECVSKSALIEWLRPYLHTGEPIQADVLISDIQMMPPTLTPLNEWVEALEAINNAAVAYIEGGPYENDLPGMELALKIDRLSRDFVRPPEGEEDKLTARTAPSTMIAAQVPA